MQVFPSSLRVRTIDEADTRPEMAQITGTRRMQMMDIVRHLMNAPVDEGISTDELTGISGLTLGQLTKALADLETLGIARNDTAVKSLFTLLCRTTRASAWCKPPSWKPT